MSIRSLEHLRIVLMTAIVGLAGCASDPAGVPSPRDEAAFTEHVRGRFLEALPGFTFTRSAPFSLDVRSPGGANAGTVTLDRARDFCTRDARYCGTMVDEFVATLATVIRQGERPTAPAMLRLILRPRRVAEAVPGASVMRLVAGELVALPVFDTGPAVKYVSESDLKRLGLDADQVFAIAERQVRETMPPLAQVVAPPPEGKVGMIATSEYDVSRVIFHRDWAALAASLGGRLVVMVPSDTVVLYADGGSPQAMAALRQAGAEVANRAKRPLSAQLLRWTESGWVVAR